MTDPTQPGPTADRIAELEQGIAQLENQEAPLTPLGLSVLEARRAELSMCALERRRFADKDGRYLLTQSQALDAFVEVLDSFPALAQSDAQPNIRETMARAAAEADECDPDAVDYKGKKQWEEYAQSSLPEGAREALEKAVAHFKDRWIAHRDAANASWDSRDNNRSMADKYWSAYCLLKDYCATKPATTPTRSSAGLVEALKEIKRIADNYEDDFEARDAIQQLADKTLRARAADRSAT